MIKILESCFKKLLKAISTLGIYFSFLYSFFEKAVDNDTNTFSTIGKSLYLTSEKADVHFIFESSYERVPAHKIILSSGSDVFETMFYGSLKEEGDVKIVDSTAGAFKQFLRFFYFNKVGVSMEHLLDIIYLGKKYNVAECLRLCSNLLETNISVQTVVTTFDLAIFYEQQQLQNSCESFIASNARKVLNSKSFRVCDRRVLEKILKMNRFTCTETQLFEASMSWMKEISREDHLTRDIVLKHMGDLFYEIQFGSMPLAEFGKLLPMYGELFSVNEYSEIIQVMSGQKIRQKLFKTSRMWRECLGSIVCERFSLFPNMYSPAFLRDGIETEEVAKFSANTSLLLRYFSVDRAIISKTKNSPMGPKVTIMSNSTGILSQFKFDVASGHKIKLPEPVLIRPGIIYEIRINFVNKARYVRINFHSVVMKECGVIVKFHNKETNVQNRIVGLVQSLEFSLLKQ